MNIQQASAKHINSFLPTKAPDMMTTQELVTENSADAAEDEEAGLNGGEVNQDEVNRDEGERETVKQNGVPVEEATCQKRSDEAEGISHNLEQA